MTKPSRSDSLYYSTAEVAAIFNVDAKSVTRWGETGKLRYVWTPGGTRRYLKADVDSYLNPEQQS